MFGASSELALNQLVYGNGIWHEPASNVFGASSELASVMEFGSNSFCRNDKIRQTVPYRNNTVSKEFLPRDAMLARY